MYSLEVMTKNVKKTVPHPFLSMFLKDEYNML